MSRLADLVLEELVLIIEEDTPYEFRALRFWSLEHIAVLKELARVAGWEAATRGGGRSMVAKEFRELLDYSSLNPPKEGFDALTDYVFNTPLEKLINDEVPGILDFEASTGYSAGRMGAEHG